MPNLFKFPPFDNFFTIFQFWSAIILGICTAIVLVAVFADFFAFHRRNNVTFEKKSLVETGTMLFFLLLFSALIRIRIGEVGSNLIGLRCCLTVLGIIAVVTGCYVNIKGRLNLGKNWANHVKIYDDHRLVQNGVYRWVRHPLYASLIWMFYGVCLMRINIGAFLATTLIFVPMMVYRAKQEEGLLKARFPEYADYCRQTGMFFPKFW